VFSVLLSMASVSMVSAECPNACSNQGTCGAFDMCTCYRNFKGNDCSLRVCPHAHAFVTSPKGDLNFDGDHYDNTGKFIVDDETGATLVASIPINSRTLTFSSAQDTYGDILLSSDISTFELNAGDAIKIGDESFIITSVTTPGSVYEVDHKRLVAINDMPVIKFLSTQVNPRGDWEMWVGDFSSLGDEGHYYMECANRGICDEKTGECKCFDGYTGSACQIEACPSDCNNRGTCETISSLAALTPVTLPVVILPEGTSAKQVRISKLCSEIPSLNTDGGDTVIIAGRQYTTTGCASSKATLELDSNLIKTHVQYGTAIKQVMNYKLWDAKQGRACKCDFMYYGTDCAKKKCPKGDDPLTSISYDPVCSAETDDYSAYTQQTEKQTLVGVSVDYPLVGTFKLSYTDEFGGKYTTEPINNRPLISSNAALDTTDNTLVSFATSLPSCSVIGVADTIIIGAYIRYVASITKTHATGVCKISSLKVTEDFPSFLENLEELYLYKMNVDVEIKEALEALPNGVIKAVNVRHPVRNSFGETAGLYDVVTDTGTANLKQSLGSVANEPNTIKSGGLIQVNGKMRLVMGPFADNTAAAVSTTDDEGYYQYGKQFDVTTDGYYNSANGFEYQVSFENGCSHDSDCQGNGVSIRGGYSSTNSDGNAKCHPSGVCVCSNKENYHGSACTSDGRGSVRRSTIYSNDGDLVELEPDCSGLHAVEQVTQTHDTITDSTVASIKSFEAHVTKGAPKTVELKYLDGQSNGQTGYLAGRSTMNPITLGIVAGDMIYLQGETRYVQSVSTTEISVDSPFNGDPNAPVYGDDTYLVRGTLFKVKNTHFTCFATDSPQLFQRTGENDMVYADQKIKPDSSQLFRDADVVNIGDRVTIGDIASSDSKTKKFYTRTVDGFTYDDTTKLISEISLNEGISSCDGESVGSNLQIYVNNKGTTEKLECSRRGLCEDESGLCTCFTGYTGPSCGVQNALSV